MFRHNDCCGKSPNGLGCGVGRVVVAGAPSGGDRSGRRIQRHLGQQLTGRGLTHRPRVARVCGPLGVTACDVLRVGYAEIGQRGTVVDAAVGPQAAQIPLPGVDLDRVEWITFEDPHLAEYHDPDIVKRAPPGKELAQMLLDGEIDAAIVGDKLPDPRLKHLIPEPEAAAQKWAERHGGIPINHMLVVRTELSRSRPDVVRDVFRQFLDSKRAAGLPEGGALDPYRFGVEACRPILQVIIDFCRQQRLISGPMSVDDLFDDTTRKLGTS